MFVRHLNERSEERGYGVVAMKLRAYNRGRLASDEEYRTQQQYVPLRSDELPGTSFL